MILDSTRPKNRFNAFRQSEKGDCPFEDCYPGLCGLRFVLGTEGAGRQDEQGVLKVEEAQAQDGSERERANS